jgi:hypothetical protein
VPGAASVQGEHVRASIGRRGAIMEKAREVDGLVVLLVSEWQRWRGGLGAAYRCCAAMRAGDGLMNVVALAAGRATTPRQRKAVMVSI